MKKENELIFKQAESLLVGNLISDMANLSALLYMSMKDLNWAGFYILNKEELFLGPFQGKPACTTIKIGKGVCGTSIKNVETIIVPNVHEYPGHIACDSASQSEIVVPIFINDKLFGVLDIDSPILNRFSKDDQELLEAIITTFSNTNTSK